MKKPKSKLRTTKCNIFVISHQYPHKTTKNMVYKNTNVLYVVTKKHVGSREILERFAQDQQIELNSHPRINDSGISMATYGENPGYQIKVEARPKLHGKPNVFILG